MSTNMWNRENTTILIAAYKRNECMWKTTSPFYRNKGKRKDALENIARILQDYRPETKIEDVKNKINGIRTQFVAEINKMINHKLEGETYEPSLWCFEQLQFLQPYTQSKQKMNKVQDSWKSQEINMNHTSKTISSKKPAYQRENYISSSITSNYQSAEPSETIASIQIKAERENDIEIIEESESEDGNKSLPPTTYSIDDPYIQPINEITNEAEQSRVQNLISTGYSSELTLVPARDLNKRKNVDSEESYERHMTEEKKPKFENLSHEVEKMIDMSEDKISIFGKFIMSQMRTVTDKVLYIKLEHTIQNAIIEAQIKQIEMDESKNK